MISCNKAVAGERQSRVNPRRSGRQESNRLEEYVRDSFEGKEENCFRIMKHN